MRRRLLVPFTVLAVTASLLAIASPASADPEVAGTYESLTSARIVNSTTGVGVPKAPIAAGKSVTFSVLGGIPRARVGTIDLIVTAISPTKNGYLTAYPAGNAKPGVSTVTFTTGESTPNVAAIPVPDSGKVTVYNGSTAPVGLAVDRIGYWTSGALDTNRYGLYKSLVAATRALDTRKTAPLGAGKSATYSLSSLGLPSTAIAVTANLGVVTPGGNGYLVASTPASDTPSGITFAFSAARTRSSFTMIAFDDDIGPSVRVTNGAKVAVDVTLDVFGYYTGGSQENYVAGQTQVLAGPGRNTDTNHPKGVYTLEPGETVGLSGGGSAGPFGAFVFHVTASGASKSGFITAWGGGSERPNTSVTNYYPNTSRTGTITIPVDQGAPLFYNGGASTVTLNLDIVAFLTRD